MRIRAPGPFVVTMVGPEGPYTLAFQPLDEWEGSFDLTLAGVDMTWSVETVDQEANGDVTLSGMTSGTTVLWNDQFWFVLRVEPRPAQITYWGNQVAWRTDEEVLY